MSVNKPGNRSSDTAGTVLFTVMFPLGLLVCGGGLYPGGWRKLLAHLVDVIAPWLITAVVGLAIVSVVVAVFRRRSGRGSLLRSWWRGWWHYRRRWADMMALHGLVVVHQERVLVPRILRVTVGDSVDRVIVRMIAGQAPPDWQSRSEALAHAFGAHTARVTVIRPQALAIDLHYVDTLAVPIPLADRRNRNQQGRDAA